MIPFRGDSLDERRHLFVRQVQFHPNSPTNKNFCGFFLCSRFAFGIRCLRTFLTQEKMLKSSSSKGRRRRNIIKQPKQQKVSLSERRIPQRKLFSVGLFRNFVQYFIRNEWTRKKSWRAFSSCYFCRTNKLCWPNIR